MKSEFKPQWGEEAMERFFEKIKSNLRRFILVVLIFLSVPVGSFLINSVHIIGFKSTTLEDSTELVYASGGIGHSLFKFFIPTLPMLKFCSTTMPYDLGNIDNEIVSAGFDRDKLLSIVQRVEKKWEDATGRNLFDYNPGESRNLVHFLMDSSDTVDGQVRLLGLGPFYPGFKIIFFAPKNATGLSLLIENYVETILLHEMGHAIGLPHLPSGTKAVMSSPSTPSIRNDLTEQDISFVREFCKSKIRSDYQ